MSSLPGRLVLLGHPVSHSRSPAFQNAALRSARIPLEYQALDVPPGELRAVVQSLIRQRAAGNVTVPHKSAVAGMCSTVTATAARVGAVNTFWTEQGELHGDNTDVAGFNALVRQVSGSEPRKLNIALIGAGGAAAAALAALAGWEGCNTRVYSRSIERARQLALGFKSSAQLASTVNEAISNAGIVINATPLGISEGDELPVEISALPRNALVIDLNYAPGETRWVREARRHGFTAADGATMLLEQGIHSFRRWFSLEPDVAAMRAALAGEGLSAPRED